MGAVRKCGGMARGRTDRLAALLSNLCVLHCVAIPLLILLLPAGLLAGTLSVHGAHGPEWLHWSLILLALPVSLYALWQGFHLHGRHRPWVIATLGFVLMAGGALLHAQHMLEAGLTVAGGLLIGAAHWHNISVWQRS